MPALPRRQNSSRRRQIRGIQGQGRAMIAKHGGRYMIRAGANKMPREATGRKPERVVIQRIPGHGFGSKRLYNSPEYQPLMPFASTTSELDMMFTTRRSLNSFAGFQIERRYGGVRRRIGTFG